MMRRGILSRLVWLALLHSSLAIFHAMKIRSFYRFLPFLFSPSRSAHLAARVLTTAALAMDYSSPDHIVVRETDEIVKGG